MIAPNRNVRTSDGQSRAWAAARRSVAAAFFGRDTSEAARPSPPVSRAIAWIFFAWTLAIAASYFAFGDWWSVGWR